MPIVLAKCTNCGANLNVDNTKDAAMCKFCGSAFIVEKAINYYSISNNNNIKNSVVNIYGGNSADFVIRAGKLEKYIGAATSVIIPSGVTSIGSSAFGGCSGLSSVEIPDGVTSIESWAFSGCSGLSSVTIPNSITSVGSGAFANCKGLTTVMLSTKLTSIESGAFENCESLLFVDIPCSIKSIKDNAFHGCEKMWSIRLNGIEHIGKSAFENCRKLRSIALDRAKIINISAFENCTSLTDIVIPSNVSQIGMWAFSGCTSLTSVLIEKGVSEIGYCAFSGCTSLIKVQLPRGIKCIERNHKDFYGSMRESSMACAFYNTPYRKAKYPKVNKPYIYVNFKAPEFVHSFNLIMIMIIIGAGFCWLPNGLLLTLLGIVEIFISNALYAKSSLCDGQIQWGLFGLNIVIAIMFLSALGVF